MTDNTRLDVPLVVDLDGTLTPLDTLHESLANAVLGHPSGIPGMLAAMARGKGAFKSSVARLAGPGIETLPLREEVLELVRSARDAGRTVVLATGAHVSIADALAARVGGFDLVLATEDGRENNVGSAKADRLVERFGESAFDYVGDSKADIPVWRRCREAFVVGSDSRARRLSLASGRSLTHLPPRSPGKAAWKILRPHQWMKNLLVFLPLLTSHNLGDLSRLGSAVLMFVAFSVAASLVYIANDFFDRDSDRRNPSKARRPIASGTLSIPRAAVLASVLLGILGAVCWQLPWNAASSIGIYLAANAAYTIHVKRRLLADIFLLAFMYVWRVVSGALATEVEPSIWLLGFSSFLFLSLGFAKRYAEVARLAEREQTSAAGRAWKTVDAMPLAAIGMGCGVGGSILLALYVTGTSFASLYRNASITLLLSPLFLYWITRIWIQACRLELHEDPVLFAAKDRITYLVGLAAMAILFVASR